MRKREPGKRADGPFAARLGLVGVDRVTDVRHILFDPANDAALHDNSDFTEPPVRPVVPCIDEPDLQVKRPVLQLRYGLQTGGKVYRKESEHIQAL